MNIRPLGTNILLKSKKEDTSSDAGFIMPNNPDQDTKIGEVIGVGKEVEEIKKGDIVCYAKFAGAEIGVYLLIGQHDILGIVEHETKQSSGSPDQQT